MLPSSSPLLRWTPKPSSNSAAGLPNKADEHKAAHVRVAEQHLAIARERLALERAKFEFNAAREALNHHNQLGQVMADPNHADDEAKIQAARERIFGKESIARINVQEQRHPKPE